MNPALLMFLLVLFLIALFLAGWKTAHKPDVIRCQRARDLFFFLLVVGCFGMPTVFFSGCSGVDYSTANATAEKQVLANLYTAVAQGATASLPALSGGNAQNGQDAIQAAWIGAGESAVINSVGDLLVDYSGPALASLGSYVNSLINKLPASLQPAAKNTAAAAIQNTINAVAPAGAQPTSAIAAAVSMP